MNKFNSSVSGLMINDENEQPYEKHPSNLDLPSDNESFNKNYLSHSKYFQTQDRTVINKKNKKSIVFPEIPTNNQDKSQKVENTLIHDATFTQQEPSESPKEKSNNLFKQLRVSMYIKKFISRCNSRKRYQKLVTPYHLNIINDEATLEAFNKLDQKAYKQDDNSRNKKSLFSLLLINLLRKLKRCLFENQKCLYLQEMIPIISPESKYKIFWDLFLGIIRFFLLFVIPLEISFHNNYLFDQLLIPFILIQICLISDVILNFNTAYYEYGQIVAKRSSIVNNYINNALLADLISVISFISVTIIQIYQDSKFIEHYQNQPTLDYYTLPLFTVILQIQNIAKVFKKFEESQSFSNKVRLLIDLLKIIIMLIYVEHIFSCIWYYVGLQDSSNSWMVYANIQEHSYKQKYLTSFYFTTVTLISVGYGDIYPQNYNERIWIIIFMFVSSMQLSYTVSAIMTITAQINEKNEEQMRKLRTINRYMQQKKISYTLQSKIRQYLNYFWQEQGEDNQDYSNEIVEQLSQDLKDNLMLEANALVLKDCSLFSKYFSDDLKKDSLGLIKTITLFPETNIQNFLKDELKDDQLIFFIEKGEIEVYFENGGKARTYAILQKGNNFGLYQFITGESLLEQYKSIGFSRLLYISRKQFFKLIKQYPLDYEKLCMLKDQIIYENIPKELGLKCYSCNSIDHTVYSCPVLNYKPDRESIIKKIQYNQQQKRTKTKTRNSFVKFQALPDLYFLSEVVEAFQFSNDKILDGLDQDEDVIQSYKPKSQPKPILKRTETKSTKRASKDRQSIQARRVETNLSEVSEDDSSFSSEQHDQVDIQRVSSFQSSQKQQFRRLSTVQYKHRESKKLDYIRRSSKALNQIVFEDPFQENEAFQQQEKMKPSLFSGKNMFQNVVEKVTSQKKKIQRQNTSNYQHINNPMSNLIEEIQIPLIVMEQKLEKLQSPIEREQLQEIILRQKNLNAQVDQEFETVRQYTIYMTQNNINKIIHHQQNYNNPHLNSDLKKFLEYFFYPFMFIKKYRLNKQWKTFDQEQEQQKRIQKLKQKALISQKLQQSQQYSHMSSGNRSQEKRKTKALFLLQSYK